RAHLWITLALSAAACSPQASPSGGAAADGTHADQAVPRAPDARLGGQIQTFIQTFEWVPGVGTAVVVIQGGKVVHLGTYGFRDRAAKKPVTADTLFAIGSTSKAFGAFASMLADQDGRLKIDSPVVDYAPTLVFSDPAVASQVTSVDLLSHRT